MFRVLVQLRRHSGYGWKTAYAGPDGAEARHTYHRLLWNRRRRNVVLLSPDDHLAAWSPRPFGDE